MDEYNFPRYERFVGGNLDFRRESSVRTGRRAPDGALIDLGSSEEVDLSEIWHKKHVVLEFGSLS